MKYIALFALAALCGCTIANQQTAGKARTNLVGKPKGAILTCLGAPDQVYQDGATEYLSYGATGRSRGGMIANSVGSSIIMTGVSRQSQCVATFAIQNGVVASVNYRSSGGGLFSPEEACGSILRNCL